MVLPVTHSGEQRFDLFLWSSSLSKISLYAVTLDFYSLELMGKNTKNNLNKKHSGVHILLAIKCAY